MRFKQYLAETDEYRIHDFLYPYIHYQTNLKYIVNTNGEIDVNEFMPLRPNPFRDTPVQPIINSLPSYIKFGTVHGTFDVSHNDLTTLRGSPKVVDGDFVCRANRRLASFEFMPHTVGRDVDFQSCFELRSLVGIHEHLKSMNGHFKFPLFNTQEGGIGLILIPGIKHLSCGETNDVSAPFKIIKKYLGKQDGIYECQSELIQAGYEEYAKL